ncbi:MAG: hypothetical protein ACRDF4_02635, partial [Rhabdochlamydiaceae bacterium]
MDIKEIAQTVAGVLILKPDQILFNSALGNSVLFANPFHGSQLSSGSIALISLLHSLLIILGLGLLIGVGLTACTVIAFFVAIGAGAGLFEAGQLLSVFGTQIKFASQPFNVTSNALVVYPFLSDLFLLAPVIIFAFGIFMWRHRRKARRLKKINEANYHLRQYCMACGVHVGPGQKKCRSCGASFSGQAPNS